MIRSAISGLLAALLALGCGSDGESPGTASGGTAGAAGAGGTAGTDGAGGTAGAGGSGGAVVIPDVACDIVKNPSSTFPTVLIGGREVIIDYPCNKPAGTKMTFIFVLHGTQATEVLKFYTRLYFKPHNYLDSHNFIVATPKSVVSQWGNGDEGRDLPHLMEVVAWVYDTFKDFDISDMWVAGHSWGSFYTMGFACNAEFETRVKGALLMSGGSGVPACASRLSLLGTVGETDIVEGELNQGAVATEHGCAAQQVTQLGNNRVTEFPNCSPNWVHKSYFMLGKGHGFDPVDWPDDGMNADIADAIKKVRGD